MYDFYKDSIYNMLKQKNKKMCKMIARKILWTFEWPKMNHIFISPYHNHFWVDFYFYFFNMYIKEFFRVVFSYGLFSSLTTM